MNGQYNRVSELSRVETTTLDLKRYHGTTWRDRSDLYWLLHFLEEVCELTLALFGLHKGPVEWELQQIATIAMNWLERRQRVQAAAERHEPGLAIRFVAKEKDQ